MVIKSDLDRSPAPEELSLSIADLGGGKKGWVCEAFSSFQIGKRVTGLKNECLELLEIRGRSCNNIKKKYIKSANNK